ncbi:SPOSA6832_03507 [Sporobolomyces salmonicolor]|uniref:SPOSA6832_03507-mRNA-1:cds n=1 Tax=Sporidiobolus salmonicolor TaxID=5005 RepID=A0A0D6EPA0_SPOSA|nr:SPOSA6832_03507 [Sporobolomyces salmonicolor]
MSSAQQRLAAVASTLSHPRGLLAGEVAIITGAAQGIGRSTALLFAQEGAKVVVSDLDAGKAQLVVDEIKKKGGEAIAVGGDVTAEGFAKKLVEETVKAFGGINHVFDKMLHTMTDEGYELMLKVHNVAPFKIIRESAPYMRSKKPEDIKKNKSIVNVASVAGLHGNVGQANYATAKAGIIGLTKTVAKEWGPFGVRCNVVAFGRVYPPPLARCTVAANRSRALSHILTRLTQAKELGEAIEVNGQKIALGIPQPKKKDDKPETFPHIPLSRPGSAEEAARAVLFLVSPLASYVSGHCLEVTGGMGI